MVTQAEAASINAKYSTQPEDQEQQVSFSTAQPQAKWGGQSYFSTGTMGCDMSCGCLGCGKCKGGSIIDALGGTCRYIRSP
ncbi:unnamed protein product [Rotaria sp. Silwood1]|nr:unnamed protein product [Rotaria sp. Silwood1]CAF1567975.1 unnamed protein product [Rotaria sp. Silwood1]